MAKENQTPNITSDTAVMLEGQMPEGQSTDTSSWGNKVRMGTLALMTALAPSATTTTITLGGVGLVTTMTMTSCGEDEPTPVDPNAIDRTTDNPAHKAEYMADVKSITLGGGVATLDFEAEWMSALKEYQLQPKSMVDFAKAAQKLEEYATASNKNVGELAFALNYDNRADVRIAWKIPYSLIKEMGGIRNLNEDLFDNYRIFSDLTPDGGSPDANVLKNKSGYLEIGITDNSLIKLLKIQVINPYYFGKTQ